ncbi:magnesium chelatase domain-containing protein, partial [Georgenia sp. 10Sc9-8]|nr:magnesium chelatase domain-containing protein [Georgenia halotolerans]
PTEIQALVAPSPQSSPRRATSGVDAARVSMTLAVLQARLGARIQGTDVYVSTVGGARATEPAVDLAVALALLGAAENYQLRSGLVAVGEVGLTGELRATVGVQRRLAEAARLGFRTAIVPKHGSEDLRPVPGLQVQPVTHVRDALEAAHPVSRPVTPLRVVKP